jgi:hypothetical protein
MSLGTSNTLYGWYMFSVVVRQLYWFSTEMVMRGFAGFRAAFNFLDVDEPLLEERNYTTAAH